MRASTNRMWLHKGNHKYCAPKECAACINTPKQKQSVTSNIERFPCGQNSDTVTGQVGKMPGEKAK